MKLSKRVFLIATAVTAFSALTLIQISHAAGPDYIQLIKKDINEGACYNITMSGSAIRTNQQDGKGPTRTYSFSGLGKAQSKPSLSATFPVSFTDRSNGKKDPTTVWFDSRNGNPVGGLILRAWNNTNIDFQSLSLRKTSVGFVLNAVSHEGEWNGTGYTLLINKLASC